MKLTESNFKYITDEDIEQCMTSIDCDDRISLEKAYQLKRSADATIKRGC